MDLIKLDLCENKSRINDIANKGKRAKKYGISEK